MSRTRNKRYCGVKGIRIDYRVLEFKTKVHLRSRHREVWPGEAGSAATFQNIPNTAEDKPARWADGQEPQGHFAPQFYGKDAFTSGDALGVLSLGTNGGVIGADT